jgi:hypothetical protein
MFKRPYYLMPVVLAACLAGSASAQNYTWSGLGDATTWSQGANWLGGVAPTPGAVQIFLGTGNPTASPLPITIGASDAVQLSDALFGPEWGQTLNIHGSVNAGFGLFMVGDMAGTASVLNLYGNASYTAGDTLALGDAWWWAGAPHVTMNLYDNAQATTKYLWLGGHLNLYGGTMTVNNFLGTGTPTAGQWGGISTDATRLMDIAGGRLILGGDATTQVSEWITRGILQGYGVVGSVAIDTATNPGYTIVTGVVPEPSTMALLGLGTGVLMLVFRRRS